MNNVAAVIYSVWFDQRNATFEWGKFDCLTFCADVAKAITGRDPVEELRGKYNTELGAQLAGARIGYKTIGDVPARFYPEIPPAFANDGDWALIINPDNTPTLGVILGPYILARTQQGLGFVERTDAKLTWKVVD